MSSAVLHRASMLYVRSLGSQRVAFIPELHRSFVFGFPPKPSHWRFI